MNERTNEWMNEWKKEKERVNKDKNIGVKKKEFFESHGINEHQNKLNK
jgi:hypothetical protein